MSLILSSLRQALSSLRTATATGLKNVVGGMGRTPAIHIVRDGETVYEEMRVYAGISSLRHSPYHDNFTLETREMREAYRKWAAEPSVKAALFGKVANVAALGLQVTPADEANPRSHEIADCVRHALNRPLIGFAGVIYEILIHSMMDGWSLCEPVWTIEDRGKFRGKRVLWDFKSKDTRYVIPRVDQFRNIIGLYNPRGNYNHLFDPAHFVVYTHLPLFRNPTGTSDLRAAYRAMQMIPACLKLRMIFLDKYTGPFLKGTVKDPAIKNKMAFELSKARADGFIVLDANSDVDVLDLVTRGTADFQAGLDDLRKEVAVGISGAFLTMYTGGQGDSRGSSEIQQDTVDLFVWWLAETVATTINHQIVPHIVDYNYGSLEDVPTVTLEAVRPSDVVADLAIDEALDRMGVDTSREELLRRARRSPPKNDSDSIQKAKQQAQPQPGGQPPGGGGPGGQNPFALPFAEPPDGHELVLLPSGLLASLLHNENLSREREADIEVQAFDSFAESSGFTGTKKDRLGRTFCYQSGRRVPCATHPDNPKNQPIITTGGIAERIKARDELAGIIAKGGGAALWEIDRIGERLKLFDGEALGHILADVTRAGSLSYDPSDLDGLRKGIVEHLKLERKDWWKKNQKRPAAEPPKPVPKPAPVVNYMQANPDHPIAVAIRNDEAGRKLVADFLTEFGPKHELASQAADLSDQQWDAWGESNRAANDYADALYEWTASLKDKSKAGRSRSAQLKAKKDQLQQTADRLRQKLEDVKAKSEAASEARRTLAEQGRQWLLSNVKPDKPSKIEWEVSDKEVRHPLVKSIVEWVPLKPSDKAGESIQKGLSFTESLASGVNSRVLFGGSDTGRAFYHHSATNNPESGGRPLVALGPKYVQSNDEWYANYTAETTVHELGHHLEKAIPGLADKGRAFREYRCGDEPVVKLKDIPGGDGYRDDERGRKNHFDRFFDSGLSAYYVGKTYGDAPGEHSEVVSMGLEALYKDPVGFAKKDPEYFQWIVTNVTRG